MVPMNEEKFFDAVKEALQNESNMLPTFPESILPQIIATKEKMLKEYREAMEKNKEQESDENTDNT